MTYNEIINYWEGGMRDDISDIVRFYDSEPFKEHARLEKHQLEFDLTLRNLRRCLPPTGRILEIGAATGRYTLELARLGYSVTAVDISSTLLDVCKTSLRENGLVERVDFVVADARDLSTVSGRDYDAVLLMGPLYHLVELTDRETAVREALARLRTGGILCSTFISRLGIMGDLIRVIPAWVEDWNDVEVFLQTGRDPSDHDREGFRAYYARPEEIEPLHESLGLTTLALVGVEPAISADDEGYNQLPEHLKPLWLDLFDRMSGEKSILAASRHLLYIGKIEY
jgi:2-polyprenyl-3-methyl-5-hydroxy-6-metoxy-1,4-benzoquinol methylase